MTTDRSEDSTIPGNNLAVIPLEERLVLGDPCVRLRRLVDDHLQHGRTSLVLDLQELEYVDTAGLGEMIRCVKRVAEKGGHMLVVPSPPIRSFMERFRLEMVFDLHENLAQAFASINSRDSASR